MEKTRMRNGTRTSALVIVLSIGKAPTLPVLSCLECCVSRPIVLIRTTLKPHIGDPMADDVFGRWLEVNAKLVDLEHRLLLLRSEIGKGKVSACQAERDLALETAKMRKLADAELALATDRFRKEVARRKTPPRQIQRI